MWHAWTYLYFQMVGCKVIAYISVEPLKNIKRPDVPANLNILPGHSVQGCDDKKMIDKSAQIEEKKAMITVFIYYNASQSNPLPMYCLTLLLWFMPTSTAGDSRVTGNFQSGLISWRFFQ